MSKHRRQQHRRARDSARQTQRLVVLGARAAQIMRGRLPAGPHPRALYAVLPLRETRGGNLVCRVCTYCGFAFTATVPRSDLHLPASSYAR